MGIATKDSRAKVHGMVIGACLLALIFVGNTGCGCCGDDESLTFPDPTPYVVAMEAKMPCWFSDRPSAFDAYLVVTDDPFPLSPTFDRTVITFQPLGTRQVIWEAFQFSIDTPERLGKSFRFQLRTDQCKVARNATMDGLCWELEIYWPDDDNVAQYRIIDGGPIVRGQSEYQLSAQSGITITPMRDRCCCVVDFEWTGSGFTKLLFTVTDQSGLQPVPLNPKWNPTVYPPDYPIPYGGDRKVINDPWFFWISIDALHTNGGRLDILVEGVPSIPGPRVPLATATLEYVDCKPTSPPIAQWTAPGFTWNNLGLGFCNCQSAGLCP